MTEAEARALATARAAERPADGWLPRQDAATGEWSVARLPGAGRRGGPLITTTERPPEPPRDDPRPANVRNIPPFGAGV